MRTSPTTFHTTRFFNPCMVPSISSKCLATYNPADIASICTADCQSAYTLYAQCTTPSSTEADSYVGVVCGRFNSTSCTTLTQNSDYYSLFFAVYSQCNSSYCSTSCSAAITALEGYSGCCSADFLNGPKVVCGQQPIAPCSTVLNSGSVATPTSECALLLLLTCSCCRIESSIICGCRV